MKQIANVHDVVGIGSGSYAGLSGVVVEVKEGSARVQIDGVRDDAPLSKLVWIRNSALTVKA